MAENERDFYRRQLGELIKTLRDNKGLSPSELAQRLRPRRRPAQHARRQTISLLESGELLPNPDREVPYLLEHLPEPGQDRRALMKALASAYVGSNIAAAFKPPVLQDYPLAARLVAALEPPIATWHDPQEFWSDARLTSLNFSLLLGAVFSLLSCLESFAVYPSFDFPYYDHTELYNELRSMIPAVGVIDWQQGHHTVLLSVGYFINKTGTNLNAAISRCVQVWLERRSSTPLPQLSFEEQLEGLKTALGADHRGYRAVDGLAQAVAAYRKSNNANNAMPRVIEEANGVIEQKYRYESFSLPKLLDDYDRLFATDEQHHSCVLLQLIYGRTLPSRDLGLVGPAPHTRFEYVVDWIAAAKALSWIADFWRDMLRDINEQTIAGRSRRSC
jgi:hypothetical protein